MKNSTGINEAELNKSCHCECVLFQMHLTAESYVNEIAQLKKFGYFVILLRRE